MRQAEGFGGSNESGFNLVRHRSVRSARGGVTLIHFPYSERALAGAPLYRDDFVSAPLGLMAGGVEFVGIGNASSLRDGFIWFICFPSEAIKEQQFPFMSRFP